MALPLSYSVQLPSDRKEITNFIDICIQKREYIEAQRAKERLFEVSEEMKKRAIHGINMKEEQSVDQAKYRSCKWY